MDERHAALLTAVVAAQRPMMLKLATYWCRRSALDPEDLVQDACARMAERDVLPTDTRGQEGFARRWLQVAWASYWQDQRLKKRADNENRCASLDALTAPTTPTTDDHMPFQPVDPETTEGVLLRKERLAGLQAAVGRLTEAERRAVSVAVERHPIASKALDSARRTLDAALRDLGYPHTRPPPGPSYPRNRMAYTAEYNDRPHVVARAVARNAARRGHRTTAA